MKTSLFLLVFGIISQQLIAQKLKYENSLDSMWIKDAYIKSISNNGNWVLINEYSDYKPILYKVANTKGLNSFNLGDCLSAEISADSQWVVFLTRDSELKILNLENGKISSLGKSTKYSINSKGNILAFIKIEKGYNTLVFRNLQNNKISNFNNINDFAWSPKGDVLIAIIRDQEWSEILKIYPYNLIKSIDECLECTYSQIKWSEYGDNFIYLKNDRYENKQIHIVNENKSKKVLHDSIVNKKFSGYQIGDWNLEISKDGKKVFFYRENENYNEGKDQNIQIWNTDDVWIYPRLKRYNQQKRMLLSLWKVESDDLMAIEDENNSSSYAHPDFPFALIYDNKKYEPKYQHFPYADIYLLDYNSSNVNLIIEKLYCDPGFFSISPSGNYISFFDDENWWLYNVNEKLKTNLTKGLNGNWTNSKRRRSKNPHLVETPFWTEDNEFILLHDNYDVWQISIDGYYKKNLTNGNEPKNSYRIYSNKNGNENLRKIVKGIGLSYNLNKPILLQTHDENLNTGFSILRKEQVIDSLILYEGKINIHHFNQNFIIYSQNRINVGPKFYRLDLETKEKYLIYEVNPELEKYDLGNYEIFSYSTEDFQSLNGVLIYPSEYDPSIQYPMIVWPYERNSSIFHKYITPSDRNNFNIYKYINNGYFVLLPDIEYQIGNPGFSALACVTAAVNKSLEKNYSINKNKLGLYGFSFGGYEAAFISTQTNLFKAVVAGAAATDLVSFYHDNWWEFEMNQAWRLESQQFRMGDSFYNLKKEYQLNSPLFHVEKLETPLLLWTGKLDTNINWYQSVFMYSAMRRLQKTGRLIIFNDEEHSLIKPENQESLSKEIFQWFETYLKY